MTRLIVITGFVVAFLAGAMAGLVYARRGPMPGPMAGGRESFLANQLGLTADQQAKMKAIWQDAGRRGGPDSRGRRGDIRREQEQAVEKLIRPEDKTAYDAIMNDAHAKLDAMEADGRRSFQQAVDKTKQILTPEQLNKYEAFLSRGPGDREHDRPTTKPTG